MPRHAAPALPDGVPWAAVRAARDEADRLGVSHADAAAIGRAVARVVIEHERARAVLIASNQLAHEGPGATVARLRGE